MKPHLRRENRLETEAVALAPGDGWVTALATPSVQYFPGGGGPFLLESGAAATDLRGSTTP